MENLFYIPISSGSLAHYFSKAIILPAKYFTNKPGDIQNKFADSLLLSVSKWVKNSDCSIEVVLTDEEIKELSKVSEHFFQYSTPLPISRVKSVCFLDTMQKETTIWNINNGAAFIPESIVSVETPRDVEVISDNEIDAGNYSTSTFDLSEKIKRFDIILGGFAFMRLGGGSFMNYSENYFSTLSYFNKLIEEQTFNAAKEKNFKFTSKYTGLFSKHESEWSKWLHYIYENLDTQGIEVLAAKEGVKIEKKLGLLKIASISTSSHFYELAVLATYGDNKTKSTDNLVTDLTNGTIPPDKVEDVSILFGLHNGYSKLRNKYKGTLKESNVKFTLESKLDYYIIESIYQFVFNSTKPSYSFDYIDMWCPSAGLKDNARGYETYKILDTLVIAKKKQTPLEFFLENYSQEIYSTIIRSITQWLSPFAKVDETLAVEHFKKQLHKTLTFSVEALQQKMEREGEENYNSQKHQDAESYKKEIGSLLLEITNLKEENLKLKSDLQSSQASIQSNEHFQNLTSYESELSEENNPGNTVQEPKSGVSINTESLRLDELHDANDKGNEVVQYNNNPGTYIQDSDSEISVNDVSTTLPVSENENRTEIEIPQDNVGIVSIVQEPLDKTTQNYYSMSLDKLKKIAKDKNIKGLSGIKKEELIKRINDAPPTLL